MSRLVAAVKAVTGLFVSDWIESGVTVTLVLAALAVTRSNRSPLIGFLFALALGAQVVVFTARGVRRRRIAKASPRLRVAEPVVGEEVAL